MGGPLEGVRVLDLSQGIAGPYATKLFSDYGADVLKVERPGRGDVARRLGPFPGDVPHCEASGVFLELNTGKRSLSLDLGTESGRDIARRLVADVDLVVESFRPGTLERLGLGPDVLAEVSPAAALVRVSNFGQDGPYRDFEADDMLLYAASGVMQATGDAEREPLRLGLYVSLFLAGGVVASMTMGALRSSQRDGAGERVDISLHEILSASMDRGGPNLICYQYSGELMLARRARVVMSALPTGVYPCADGYIEVTTLPNWIDRVFRTIEREDLEGDPEVAARAIDPANKEEFDAIFYPWVLTRTKQEVMEAAQANGWAASALNTMEDVFRDPSLQARHFMTPLAHPVAGTLDYPGLPIRMRGTPGEMRRAPLLGEHSSEVLEALGYTPEDIVVLRQRGVI